MVNKAQSPNLSPAASIHPESLTAAKDGDTVDLQGYDAATVVFQSGTITDGEDWTPTIEEADDDGSGSPDTWTTVAAADLTTALAVFEDADDDEVRWTGYKGTKRYIRAVLTPGDVTTGGVFSAVVIRGLPWDAPTQ